jgi:2-amino-4-hydroxy-6-hydroxymethyldihydropteridine diphosphokinase
MARALLGLGSNIEPRRDYLKLALKELRREPLKLVKASSLYETEPMDVKDQAFFLNMGAEIETALEPEALLERLKEIEFLAGKKVERRRGPRTLDLDLWFHDDLVMESDNLTLPHPKMAERPFVLIPMDEIAPDWKHPLNGLTASEMLGRIPKPWPELKRLGALG